MSPSDRLTLGFDTSAAHCAAALVRGDVVLAEVTEDMSRGQAERLMPLLEALLAEAGFGWEGLEAIGVGVGPGNFTGIRISVAAARGLALGLGIPCEGVTGPEAYAQGMGDVTVVLPAPRGQVHLARGAEILLHDPETPVPEAFKAPLTGPGAHLLTDVPTASAPLAASIARIAAVRAGPERPRPAPLYLRPADALPASDPPPALLRGV